MNLILAVVLVPLIAALVLPVLNTGLARFVAVLAAVATFVLALLLPGEAAFSVPWLPELGVSLALSGDGASVVLVATATLVMACALLYAGWRVTHRTSVLLALLLGMLGFLNGVFLARDLVVFYVFWEATLIPSLIMLGVWGGSGKRAAVLKYLIYAMAGSLLMLVGIIALKVVSGAASFHFDDLLLAAPQLDLTAQALIFAAFALAFCVKLPVFPLHSWLIDFHEQNHPSGVADVAGTLYKVGAFGFFAWAIPLLPAAAAAAAPILIGLAAFTALYAGVVAVAQKEFKRLLAYASLSHMGIVGVGVFSLQSEGMTGAMLLLSAQMLSTGALFLLGGMLAERRGTLDLAAYGGLAKSAPLLAGTTLFIIFASIGVPGLGNFPGEFMSLLGGFLASPWWAAVATVAVIAAGTYGVNLYQRLFQAKEERPAAELSGREVFVLAPLVAGILWFGFVPSVAAGYIDQQTGVAAESLAAVDAGLPMAVAPELELLAEPPVVAGEVRP